MLKIGQIYKSEDNTYRLKIIDIVNNHATVRFTKGIATFMQPWKKGDIEKYFTIEGYTKFILAKEAPKGKKIKNHA